MAGGGSDGQGSKVNEAGGCCPFNCTRSGNCHGPKEIKAAGEFFAAQQSTHRPGNTPAPGLRAGGVVLSMITQTAFRTNGNPPCCSRIGCAPSTRCSHGPEPLQGVDCLRAQLSVGSVSNISKI